MKHYDVIFIDDEPTMTAIFEQVVNLKHQKWVTRCFNDSVDAIEHIDSGAVSATIWIIDLMMPGKNGIDVARAVRKSGDTTSILVGYTALDPQSISRSVEYRDALAVFSRITSKQEGFIKLLAGLELSILQRIKNQK